MCGLFGFVGNHPKKTEILRSLCIQNSERGEHSAGIAHILSNTNFRVFKKAVHPIKFANLPEFGEMTKKGICHIGHTRHATIGEKTDENSHPFTFGKTVGTHNGMVANLQEVKQHTKQDFEVDSQYLIWLLNEKNSLEPARGGLTVAFYQKGAEEWLNIMRFGNQVHLVGDSTCEWLAYSSVMSHLALAFGMANADFSHQYELKDGEHVKVYRKDRIIKLSRTQTNYKHERDYRTTTYAPNYPTVGHAQQQACFGHRSVVPFQGASATPSASLYDTDEYECHLHNS